MFLYEIRAALPENSPMVLAPRRMRYQDADSDEIAMRSRRIAEDTLQFWERLQQSVRPFVADQIKDVVVLGAISDCIMTPDIVADYLHAVNLPSTDFNVREISCNAFSALTDRARQHLTMEGLENPMEDPRLEPFSCCSRTVLKEQMIGECRSFEELVQCAKDLLSASLEEEIRRIFAVVNDSGAVGHPVHYILRGDDAAFLSDARSLLLEALFSARRIRSRRVSFLTERLSERSMVHDIYNASGDATVCLDFSGSDEDTEESSFLYTGPSEIVEFSAQQAWAHHENVLSIAQFQRTSDKLKQLLCDTARKLVYVEIREDVADAEQAKAYLLRRAAANNVPAAASLTDRLETDARYSPSELNHIFDTWRDEQLRTTVYPQYAHLTDARKADEAPVGGAYEKLDSMIGLGEAKRQVKRVLDFFKAQKLFRDLAVCDEAPSMHMVFSGSPGTAKTTVARLVGRILKENDILSSGHIVEVGRQDLIGKFVGHTAPLVARRFRDASGGILFIDEAYSLLDDREGLYGDEALSTIVQQMENNRSDVMVIMAGYKDNMEKLLQRNPGLRSRIAAHITFDDYSAEELWQITQHMAKTQGLRLADGVRDVLMPIYERVRRTEDFGNGRYVRNMLEQARMAQATRLLSSGVYSLTKELASQLVAEDFSEISVGAQQRPVTIGFAS